jgi:putative membrane protein
MSIRRLMAAAGGLAVALAAAPVSALHSQATPRQDTPTNRSWGAPTTARPQAGPEIRADSALIREATAGSLLEIRLGNLAETKAINPAVKQFGQRMVTDHTTMQNQWSALAARNGLPKAGLDQAQEQEASQLAKLSGAEFDRAYMTSMIQDHQHDVDAFQSQGPSARSAEVRQLAASSLGTIQQHLTLARQVGSQVGATTNVAAAPQNPPAPTPSGQVAPQRAKAGQEDLKDDKEFIRDVTAAGVMEVRLGEMAQQKATDPAVKRFADQMVTEFTRLQDQWTGMASRNGMSFQPGMGPLHKDKVDRLQKASRADFDRVYMSIVIQNHQALLPYYQNEGRSAHSPQVRNLAEKELPTLQKQLAEAKRIGTQVKADTTLAGRERNVSTKNRKK